MKQDLKMKKGKRFYSISSRKRCNNYRIEKIKTKENPPLLFNLAEIQNECTKRFKIKPDETLEIIQNLYEKN